MIDTLHHAVVVNGDVLKAAAMFSIQPHGGMRKAVVQAAIQGPDEVRAVRMIVAVAGVLVAASLARTMVRVLPHENPLRIYVSSSSQVWRWRDLSYLAGRASSGDA